MEAPPDGSVRTTAASGLGTYRVGGDVALEPATGGEISAEDYALGFVDLIERNDLSRVHVNLAH